MKNMLKALEAEYESAKEEILHDFKRRGMSSEDVLKHNDEVRRIYAKAGIPVLPFDLMQDFCAQALAELAVKHHIRSQEIFGTDIRGTHEK